MVAASLWPAGGRGPSHRRLFTHTLTHTQCIVLLFILKDQDNAEMIDALQNRNLLLLTQTTKTLHIIQSLK